ncbi:MAG: hypothetical protein U1E62_06730 [Alsobacter sp.]
MTLPAGRILALTVAGATAAAGLMAGLWRLGWSIPVGRILAELHAPLMVCGALGALIGIERAVAWRKGVFWLTPALGAVGTVLALAGWQSAAALTYGAGAFLFTVGCLIQVKAEPGAPSFGAAAAAASWTAGCFVWLTTGWVVAAGPWWLVFLVLTILSERLEMSRILAPAASDRLFVAGTALTLGSCWSGWQGAGETLAAVGLAVLTAATLRGDVACLNIRREGAVRFYAACMLTGYAWLALASCILAFGLSLDAAVHAITLGFVLSMIFGHAPIILPAVLRVRVRHERALYSPLVLLQAGVAARVIGSVAGLQDLRLASGAIVVTGIACYAACLTWASNARPRIVHGETQA